LPPALSRAFRKIFIGLVLSLTPRFFWKSISTNGFLEFSGKK